MITSHSLFSTANLRRKNETAKHFPEKINFVAAIFLANEELSSRMRPLYSVILQKERDFTEVFSRNVTATND